MKQKNRSLLVFATISFFVVFLIIVLSAKTPGQIDNRYLTASAAYQITDTTKGKLCLPFVVSKIL